jgi:hypothetical protein
MSDMLRPCTELEAGLRALAALALRIGVTGVAAAGAGASAGDVKGTSSVGDSDRGSSTTDSSRDCLCDSGCLLVALNVAGTLAWRVGTGRFANAPVEALERTGVGPTSDSERVRDVRDEGRVPAFPPRKPVDGAATDDLDEISHEKNACLSMHYPAD